jgi:hypothetical protein
VIDLEEAFFGFGDGEIGIFVIFDHVIREVLIGFVQF